MTSRDTHSHREMRENDNVNPLHYKSVYKVLTPNMSPKRTIQKQQGKQNIYTGPRA